jgi:hypothetical protein
VSTFHPKPTQEGGARRAERRGRLDLCALGQRESIFNIDAEISDIALDLRVAEKDLNRS